MLWLITVQFSFLDFLTLCICLDAAVQSRPFFSVGNYCKMGMLKVQAQLQVVQLYLEEVIEGISIIVWRLSDGGPHPLQILLPRGLQLLQWSLGHVSEDKQEDSLALVGCWCEELEVDLHLTAEVVVFDC